MFIGYNGGTDNTSIIKGGFMDADEIFYITNSDDLLDNIEEPIEEFPEKSRIRKERRRRDAAAEKRRTSTAKMTGACTKIRFSEDKGRVVMNGKNKGIRFCKKTASKKARKVDTAGGNAYRKTYDVKWITV